MTRGRYDRLDALRAVAMLWMAAFHFAFDLNYFGFLEQNFYTDPKWTLQRTCIVSLFLFCAGIGQAVAFRQGQPWPRFWQRWARVAAAALLVSIGSYLVFPRSFISFGVLHGIAVMLVVTRLVAGRVRPIALAVLGLLAVIAPLVVQSALFDGRWMNWVGLVTRKPITEDYVPLLPWIGMMWWGFAAGHWLLEKRPRWIEAGVPSAGRWLALLGRWSLSFYLIHQPVLFALIASIRALSKSVPAA